MKRKENYMPPCQFVCFYPVYPIFMIYLCNNFTINDEDNMCRVEVPGMVWQQQQPSSALFWQHIKVNSLNIEGICPLNSNSVAKIAKKNRKKI